jgi:5-methylcytosine-specific restriction protein B
MYPLYEIQNEIIPHADVLKKINNAIIERKGHDFQIGHAYFMSKDKLETKLNQRVIPLLMEYFMNQSFTDGTKILTP